MITNERQYEHTNKMANGFRMAIAQAEAEKPSKRREVVIAGLRAQLEPLEAELRAYDALKASGGRTLEATIEQLGVLLIQARIARGWRQKDLAERLEVPEETIQRYEKTEYETASLLTIQDTCRVLGLKLICKGPMIKLEQFGDLSTLTRKRAGAKR